MNHSRIAIATVFVAGLLAVGCCKKKPGDSCSGTSPSCLDENNLLVCEKGTLISTGMIHYPVRQHLNGKRLG
ncbi:MAG TPA: hypothetical protein PKL73_23010, partial [Polyangiaceae bacterium]|nr:hypothetical protein [Polyangiaceae bacterium]